MDTIDKIFDLMNKNSLTPASLGKEINISNSLFTQWKQRKQKPSLDAIIKISNYFNVSIDYLVTGREYKVNTISTITKDEQQLLNEYRCLNVIGQSELIKHASLLTKANEYRKKAEDDKKSV